MKRFLATLAATLVATAMLAEEAVTLGPLTLVAGTTNSVSSATVRGKVVYAVIYQDQAAGTTNAVSITTAAGKGLTLGAARTIVASTNVTTTAVESSPSVYLFNDTVVLTAISNGTNTNTGTVRAMLIVEHP